MKPSTRDASLVALVALLARLAVVFWAAPRIAPTADATYYQVLATRLAEGHGYTWLWPDGAVTYAAHYPVGYPAILAVFYFVFGAKAWIGMLVNAVVGALGAASIHVLLEGVTSRRLAFLGALAIALHPALVPYTAALMTEGVTAALLSIVAALVVRARSTERRLGWLAGASIVMGITVLVRPQSLLLAPVFGWLATQRSLKGAIVMTCLAVATCAPWTLRNCVHMKKCALVSVNGGWNLAIGTESTDGGWHEVTVPDACKDVFDEAEKDTCFGREARRAIVRHPAAWLARVPAKVRMTLDYFGAAPWYLHASSPERFSYDQKTALGAIETLAARLFLAAALIAVMRIDGPRRKIRLALCVVGLVACVIAAGTVGYLACALAILALGPGALARGPLVVPITAAVVLLTALTHAVFFGAGRYGLVVVPFVTALGFVRARSTGSR